MKILALEAYYDGSHKAFIDGWRANSTHDVRLLTLPGHHWKWRMRHSAWTFAQQANELLKLENYSPDAFFCSSMLNLGEFLGLLTPQLRGKPAVCYFHENQLSYPDPTAGQRDIHFGLSNITSALAADQVIFNSAFNRKEFLTSARELLTKMPDNNDISILDYIEAKSEIIHPGINCRDCDCPQQKKSHTGPLKIMWAARWEHDKNFDDFAAATDSLTSNGCNFEIIVAGQNFRTYPAIFDEFKHKHDKQIIHWGYCDSDQYRRLLQNCDVFVSTARHEFFGISVMEAIAAGANVALPERLSYADLFSDCREVFYGQTASDLTEHLQKLIKLKAAGKMPAPSNKLRSIAFENRWSKIAQKLDLLFSGNWSQN